MEIALVSRSLAPFGGGGIGQYVDTAARLLSTLGHVTIFTTSAHRPAFGALGDGRGATGGLAHGVDYVFVEDPQPEDRGGFYSALHVYAARVLDAIAERYPDGGPDLIEASDYLGEAGVLAQARATGDPRLRRSVLAVRIHTSAEIATVLDGHLPDDAETRATYELERLALRYADTIIWAGGDVLRTYADFYGPEQLAPATRIRYPLLLAPAPTGEFVSTDPGRPVRFLFLGRLERRKGVQNLLRAFSALPNPEARLTLLGGDTRSAPLGGSLRTQLELMAGEDPRIEFLDHVPMHELPAIVAAHDAVVLPSLWENWPYVALEALAANRPILATPTGGFTEIVEEGRNGWLTPDVTAEGLEQTLLKVLGDRDGLQEMVRTGGPRASAEALVDPADILSAYEQMSRTARRGPTRRPRPGVRPLVSAIVTYYKLADHIEETVRSLVGQTYSPLEIIIVNDGSFWPDDAVLAEIVARHPVSVLSQENAGLGAARTFGISQARGQYVLPVDADNVFEPTFVERCVEVLEHEPDVAYVTTWTQYIDDDGAPLGGREIGYQPLGNHTGRVLADNVAGDASAVLRARLFDLGFAYDRDLTSFEDWQLYRELHLAGHIGRVIPERLLRYRVRADGMLQSIGLRKRQRILGEMDARLREGAMQWQSKSA